ncbi:MAG: twin-arginine translocation signal domain-containing protein [Xanthomonadales bacterium]|nr:twin-arginine translocation signal domain-containing protein [Xanthomonadales bacterium]
MGIGRRDFLKAFGATIAAYAAGPLQPVVLGGEYYINRSLGLAFRQPVGWNYISVKEFPKPKHDQVVEDNLISEMLLSGSDPYVAMSRPNPGKPEMLPASMTAFAEDFFFEEGESLPEVPAIIARAMEFVLEDYELIGQGKIISLSGTESVEYYSRFRFVTSEFSALTRQRSVVGVRRGAIFTFNFFDYPEIGVDGQADFSSILRSVTYA